MYEQSLVEEAGLTAGEAKVYLALLELGATTAGPIIEKSKISPSFIYNVLNSLIDKGLAAFVHKEGVRHYQAAEPSRILDYIEKRKQDLDANHEKIQALLPKLFLLQGLAPTTNVALFQGFKGIQTCFERYQTKLKQGDEYLCLGIVAYHDEKYHAYWRKHHLQRIAEGIACRMLFNSDTPREVLVNRNSYEGCDTRYMTSDVKTPAWFFIYADVVSIFLLSGEPFAIEITNKEVADTFRAYFEDYWTGAVPFA